MIYGSVCSGIEAATVAWHPLGWQPAFFSEIDKFPRAVLAHHYPDVPLHGDFTTIQKGNYAAIDLLVGGTPCQSFSVAGLRKGLDDPRGNLMLEFGALAERLAPRWIVWENVPGVLSSNNGRDFGAFLGMLGELGYGFAYRVLDAQFFGVAQRRRRVFVVGCLGNWRAAAAVLFDAESLRGHPAPSREAGQEITPTIRAGAANGGKGHGARIGDSKDELIVPIAGALTAHAFSGGAGGRPEGAAAGHFVAETARCVTTGEGKRQDYETCTLVTTFAIQAGALRTNPNSGPDGVGVQKDHAYTLESRAEVQAVAYRTAGDGALFEEGASTAPLTTGTDPCANIVAFSENIRGEVCESQITRTLQTSGGKPGQGYVAARIGMQVRRLTPRECERLQGFPDDYTLIPLNKQKPVDALRFSADGPRYKALGNSMAVPVMHWIGSRIAQVDAITRSVDAVAA